jgi:uncharacterized caspase-like protein
MNNRHPGLSRRSMTTAVAFVGLVSLAIGAHAALNKRSLDVAKSQDALEVSGTENKASRLALVIGNGHYPDAGEPLSQPINDARALTGALRQDGFDVDVVEDATRDDMDRAIDRLKSRIRPDSVVMLFFGGFGIQAGHENYMIPVDATIWKERDVRHQGLSVERVLATMKEHGAHTKLAVIDASRRNPYERRFRSFSHGLAPINAPDNALVLSSTAPGKVVDDAPSQNSLLVSELLNSLSSPAASAESAFTHTGLAVSRASDGAQVPAISSSLVDDVTLGSATAAATPKVGG